MTRIRAILSLSLLLFVGMCMNTSDTGCVPFTMANIALLPHPEVLTFSRAANGVWSGTTVDGRTFTQYPVPNSYGLRIERFVFDDYAHFVVEGQIVYSLQELSVRLAPTHTQPHV